MRDRRRYFSTLIKNQPERFDEPGLIGKRNLGGSRAVNFPVRRDTDKHARSWYRVECSRDCYGDKIAVQFTRRAEFNTGPHYSRTGSLARGTESVLAEK